MIRLLVKRGCMRPIVPEQRAMCPEVTHRCRARNDQASDHQTLSGWRAGCADCFATAAQRDRPQHAWDLPLDRHVFDLYGFLDVIARRTEAKEPTTEGD